MHSPGDFIMSGMKVVDIIADILLIIGALYLGFWGLFNIDIGGALFGGHASVILRLIFILFGLAGAYEVVGWNAIHRRWCMHLPQHA
jgi:uncharacterized membrane protein YuzA (DUF378 family)